MYTANLRKIYVNAFKLEALADKIYFILGRRRNVIQNPSNSEFQMKQFTNHIIINYHYVFD